MSISIPCPRVDDYEDDGEGGHPNACTGIIWRPDAGWNPEPTPGTGGEWTFRVYEDAEGDFMEPGGRLINRFTACEVVKQTCVCELSDKEMTALEERAIEQAKERA